MDVIQACHVLNYCQAYNNNIWPFADKNKNVDTKHTANVSLNYSPHAHNNAFWVYRSRWEVVLSVFRDVCINKLSGSKGTAEMCRLGEFWAKGKTFVVQIK